MTSFQRTIKYLAIAFAIFLSVAIISTIATVSTTILSITGIIEAPNSEKIEFTETYENITSLNISLKHSQLTIEKGETFKLTANSEKDFSPKVQNGTLIIREKSKNFLKSLFWKNTNQYTLTIPEDSTFDHIEINLDAGKAHLNNLNTQKLKINAGAGKITASNLSAHKEAKIQGGVGKFDLTDCSFNNLSMECGVGKLTFKGNITGKSKINSGIGAVNIQLTGQKQDYEININTGLGRLTIDGIKQSDDTTINQGAENIINVKGGIGDTSIDFVD